MTLKEILDYLDGKGIYLQNRPKEYLEKALNNINYSLESEVQEIESPEQLQHEAEELDRDNQYRKDLIGSD